MMRLTANEMASIDKPRQAIDKNALRSPKVRLSLPTIAIVAPESCRGPRLPN